MNTSQFNGIFVDFLILIRYIYLSTVDPLQIHGYGCSCVHNGTVKFTLLRPLNIIKLLKNVAAKNVEK